MSSLTKIRARYPIRAGQFMIDKGAVGVALREATPRILESFPNLRVSDSPTAMILVKFDGVPEILIYQNQVDIEEL